MAGRGPRSQEGMYTSPSPPSSDPHDPFSNAQMPEPHRYYDQEDDHIDQYGRRDTYGSEGSNLDEDRYYEQGGAYDYGEHWPFIPCALGL